MPWTDHSLMNERMIFIAACLADEGTMIARCARHGISRKTGHKWLARYQALGAAGLVDRSSARHTQPHLVAPAMADRPLLLRGKYPHLGAAQASRAADLG